MRYSLVQGCLLGLLVVGFLFSSLAYAGQALNNIQFTDEMWSEEFIGISQHEPVYLSKTLQFDVPPPPANDSQQTQDELRELLKFEKELRIPEQIHKIKIEQKGVTDLVFGLGEAVPQSITDRVDMVRTQATRDSHYFIYKIKRQYKRPRPTQLEPTISLVIPIPGSPAYPSGHATISWVSGRVFSYIDPTHKDQYMKFAGDVGLRRAISGIHYMSDSAAGRHLADQVFETLLQVPVYKKEIDSVRDTYQAYLEQKGAYLKMTPEEQQNFRFPEAQWTQENLDFIAEGPFYLAPDTDFGLKPPPANTSPETLKELDTLRKYAKSLRTLDVVEKIKAEDGLAEAEDDGILLGGPLIHQFDGMQNVQKVLRAAFHESTYFMLRLKKEFARPRPTQLAPDLMTVIPVPGHAAYPSGHSTQMHMFALVLGALDPAHEKEYWAMADEIALRREIAGLHYLSDTQAGVVLARAVFDKLMENAKFQKAFSAAKAEFLVAQGHEKPTSAEKDL